MFVRIYRVEPSENHRLDVFEAGQWLKGGTFVVSDGIPNLGVGNVLDIGNQETDFAPAQFFDFDRLGREHAQRLHLEDAPV